MPPTNHSITPSERESLTWAKVSRFLSLPFQPSRLSTYLAAKHFNEVPLNTLLQDGIKGVLIDADGTMLQKGFKVAIYTNAAEDRFQSLEKLGVKVVKNVPSKPDRAGFEIAMKEFLGLNDPFKICMIGDNYITDGGAIDVGMRFIHIQPITGNEPFIHALTRYLAYLCARIYGKIPQPH